MPERRHDDSVTPLGDGVAAAPAAIICDLDGTLVDSGLDFTAIRAEMGIDGRACILEALDGSDDPRAARGRAILDRHEYAGARRAAPLPGVKSFLELATALGLKRGLFTRNSRGATRLTLLRCGLHFDRVLTRDDGPAKPDPWAIHQMGREWNIAPHRTLVFGDFHYDMAAGRAAGAVTVLVCHGRPPAAVPGHELADLCVDSFTDTEHLRALLRCGVSR